MIETPSTERAVWLAADVPPDVAARFHELARAEHRSGRAQLRLLIERFAAEQTEDS